MCVQWWVRWGVLGDCVVKMAVVRFYGSKRKRDGKKKKDNMEVNK